MPLEIRKTSQWWYGRYNIDNKVQCVNLGIKIAGRRPDSITQEGDGAFERSRGQALEKLVQVVEETKHKRSAEDMLKRMYEVRTGNKVPTMSLADLPTTWANLLRDKPISPRYSAWAQSTLKAFSRFISDHHPKVQEMSGVTHEMAEEYLRKELERKLSAKSWNDELTLLRSTFHALRRKAALAENPFDDIPKRQVETISRTPFTAEELQNIIRAAQDDDLIRPIVITGICTALRRGDCCLLRWADVDMKNRFIGVKTLKTGKPAQIPMFPMLYDELCRALPAEGEYVFPEQAKMYQENPDGITIRFQHILKAAGFSGDKKKKEAKETKTLRVKRPAGIRKASIRDFHSFRTTWITMALSAGIPLEIVRKVTGHRTVEVVLEHYFQPGREEFRQLIQTGMPKLLTGGQKSPKEEIMDILEAMTPETLEADRLKIKDILSKL